jgi:tRNA pseudouridine55 synthase
MPQEYRTTCLLGAETDSYDSQGAIVRRARWKHVTREAVEAELGRFTGTIQQTPPMCVVQDRLTGASDQRPISLQL